MKSFTIFTATCRGEPKNCRFPNKTTITDEASLIAAARFDHVTAEYKDNYRSNGNFIPADVVPLDCDNDHSENENEWVTPLDVSLAFPDVSFAVVYSRSHMKEKGGKPARPRFHVYFPVNPVFDPKQYADIKNEIQLEFPFFDNNALDSARFLFGVDKPNVELYDGGLTVVEYLDSDPFAFLDDPEHGIPEISEGSRNSTLSHFAGRLIKRLGATDEAYQKLLKFAERCNPPLPQEEIDSIWRSAKVFGKRVSKQDGYIPPDQYNGGCQLKPEDYSDVGQALVLTREYSGALRYSPSTDFLVYNGSYWDESKTQAQAITQEFTTRQLEEAEIEMQVNLAELVKNGGYAILAERGPKKAPEYMTDVQRHAFDLYQNALTYRNFAIKCRDSHRIAAAMKEAQSMVQISQEELDADEYLLNTPGGTYDLRTGTRKDHNHLDYITKETATDPGEKGAELWQSALDTFFQSDAELISYVQQIVGLAAIGKVCVEALIIAYGEGKNGKSTFWNSISQVLGTYSGHISADMLTVGCRRNVKPELAEAKGKRLLIASELEEGMRLNTANVKQLCSTDEIYAEKKYKAPFSYVPSHTLVLYTNHLPKVGAIDRGTWRRLIVIPFNAVIEGSQDIKNYTDYLVKNAAPAILAWILEGAKKVIAENYHLDVPQKVKDAIAVYKENNDWLSAFLDDCCEIGENLTAKSGELYTEYRNYCVRMGEYTRSTTDFYTAIESKGFYRHKTNKGVLVHGLCLKSEFLE